MYMSDILEYHKSKNYFYIDKTIRMSLISINLVILLILILSDVTSLDWSHLRKARRKNISIK